jgi:hypothetical protein
MYTANATPCSLVKITEVSDNPIASIYTMDVKAAVHCEKSANFYQATRLHIP